MSENVVDLRILIVAADPLTRAGLATLLADQPGCDVTAQVPLESDLMVALDVYQPDALTWDLGWEPENSLERLNDVVAECPPIVALVSDETFVPEALSAGVEGVLLRDVSAERLAAALQAAVAGLMVLDPAFDGVLRPTQDLAPAPLVEELTPRELEVLQLLAQGLSNKAIAYELDISEHTVKFHVNAIMNKLGAQSRTEAAVRATRMGLILL